MQLQQMARHTWLDVLQRMLCDGFTRCYDSATGWQDVTEELQVLDSVEKSGFAFQPWDYVILPETAIGCGVLRPADGAMVLFARPLEARRGAGRGGIPFGMPVGGPGRDGYDR